MYFFKRLFSIKILTMFLLTIVGLILPEEISDVKVFIPILSSLRLENIKHSTHNLKISL